MNLFTLHLKSDPHCGIHCNISKETFSVFLPPKTVLCIKVQLFLVSFLMRFLLSDDIYLRSGRNRRQLFHLFVDVQECMAEISVEQTVQNRIGAGTEPKTNHGEESHRHVLR